MNKAFGAAFFRFRRSKTPILVFAFVAVILLSVLVGLIVGASDFVPDPDFGKDTAIWEGEDIPYKTVYEYLVGIGYERLESGGLSEEERHAVEMDIARYEYFLETDTDERDYYDMRYEYSFGGAYWMQALFFVGIWTSIAAALVVSIWFFPGAKSGVLRTEFLTGTSRRALWTGKTGAAVSASVAVPAVFSTAMLIAALCASDVRFLAEDGLFTRVYGISVFAQWIAETAAMCAVAALTSAFVNVVTCLSEDSAVGAVVPSVAILMLTLGMYVLTSMFPSIKIDNTTATLFPFIGLATASFDDGANALFGITVSVHAAAAALCFAVSYAAFRRKTL